MALHLCMELPEDKIIFDVGHQSYTHKLLTGRKDEFDTLRKFGGMSGFPKRRESNCDAFDTGHSSTSISAGLGLVKSRDLSVEDYGVYAVIGDGDLDMVLIGVDGTYLERQWHFLAAVLDRVIEQVKDHVSEVHAVHIDDGVLGVEVGIDVASVFLDLEFEGIDDAVDAGVGILFLKAHGGVLAVEQ